MRRKPFRLAVGITCFIVFLMQTYCLSQGTPHLYYIELTYLKAFSHFNKK